ncbi:unnamed protein product, partial [Tetraodon nigroviridis]
NRARLLCMLTLTFVFFIVEVVVSRITSSLSMLSDSFHMLSDVIALIVALVAVRFAEKTHSTSKNTFGWIRAEVMGALVNAVFLTALCFTIVLEAIERFTEPHEIESPEVVAGVGAAGLLVNLLGLCLFHGHAGGGHGHSHGSKNKKLKMGEAGEGSPAAETSTLVDNHNSPTDPKPKNGSPANTRGCAVCLCRFRNHLQGQRGFADERQHPLRRAGGRAGVFVPAEHARGLPPRAGRRSGLRHRGGQRPDFHLCVEALRVRGDVREPVHQRPQHGPPACQPHAGRPVGGALGVERDAGRPLLGPLPGPHALRHHGGDPAVHHLPAAQGVGSHPAADGAQADRHAPAQRAAAGPGRRAGHPRAAHLAAGGQPNHRHRPHQVPRPHVLHGRGQAHQGLLPRRGHPRHHHPARVRHLQLRVARLPLRALLQDSVRSQTVLRLGRQGQRGPR